LNDIAVDEQKLRAPVSLALGHSVSSRSVATNTHALVTLVGQENISQTPQQEEGIGAEEVQENDPAKPCPANADQGHEV
tara:strand:+ start:462 stop:698 length:237 start_codon:yes stop_codon:yes gene_type:complete